MEGTQRGLLLVLSAPSGGGKGTVLKEMFAQDGNLRLSVSATTRAPRPGEVDGQQYYFLSQEEFEQRIASGGMLEYAQYVGHYYGTPRAPVEKWLDEGRDVVLEIEVEGAMQVRERFPEALLVFVLPPSFQELERRLTSRGTETPEQIGGRLAAARRELALAPRYDYLLVNDKVEEAAARLGEIIRAAKCTPIRNESLLQQFLSEKPI